MKQFAQLIRLRIYNHYAGRLPNLLRAPSVTPFDMYMELRGLLGEMSSLYPDRHQLFEATLYDHDNPMRSFEELCSKIRNVLHGPKPRRLELKFAKEGRRMFAAMTEEHLNGPIEYYLSVRTKQEVGTLAKLVEDRNRFKLMPRSEVENEVYGIALEHERYPLPQLPTEVGLHYFRLNRAESGKAWDKIRNQRSLGARWPSMENSDYVVSLWMTLPEEENAK